MSSNIFCFNSSWMTWRGCNTVCGVALKIKGPASRYQSAENPAALSIKLTKGQNTTQTPKNTLSSGDRQASMCECMSAHTSQSTRSVIIYCFVNLDLLTEMKCLKQTQRRWNSRGFWNNWLSVRGGVGDCWQLLSLGAKDAMKDTLHREKVCSWRDARTARAHTHVTSTAQLCTFISQHGWPL